MIYIWFLAYMGTLAIAVVATRTFFVLDLVDVLVIVPALLVAPLFVLREVYSASARAGVALAHVLVAVLIHPAVTLPRAEVISQERQVEVLEALLANDRSIPESKRTEMLASVARSLRDDELHRMKIKSPWLYWASPTSVVLAAWGCVMFFLLPRGAGRHARLWE